MNRTKRLSMKTNSDAHSYFGRGMVLLANENFALAQNDFERAIELAPKQASYYLGRASVREAQGQLQEALR